MHNQQSSLPPALVPPLQAANSWAGGQIALHCPETWGNQTETNQRSMSAQNVEYTHRDSAEPRIWASRRKGECLLGRSDIRLRSLCNAQVPVLCDSQAGLSLHPKIVNVSTVTSPPAQSPTPWLYQHQGVSSTEQGHYVKYQLRNCCSPATQLLPETKQVIC